MSSGSASQAQTNPYNTALDAIAGLGIALGMVAWALGGLVFGGFLLSAGTLALVATLSVRSVRLHLSQLSSERLDASNAVQQEQQGPSSADQ